MNPLLEIATLFYENHPTGQFQNELDWYVKRGTAILSPNFAVLYRPCSTFDKSSYENMPERWDYEHSNAWFIAYAAGDVKKLGKLLTIIEPHYQYIIWARSKQDGLINKIYKTSEFIKTYGKIS